MGDLRLARDLISIYIPAPCRRFARLIIRADPWHETIRA
jgi:hypothetical protein